MKRVDDKQILVKLEKNGIETEELFDTVMQAVGRDPNTKNLGLENIGVQLDTKTNKVLGGFEDCEEQSSISNVFALGDVL